MGSLLVSKVGILSGLNRELCFLKLGGGWAKLTHYRGGKDKGDKVIIITFELISFLI